MQANRESEFALELRHVNHHYGSKQILFDMNLQLPPDRIYGLLGRNGAGKTTLINLISAQIFQSFEAHGRSGDGRSMRSPGQALIFGHTAYEHRDTMKRLCVIREKTNMPDSLRVGQALKTAASLYPNWDEQYAKHLMERFALDPRKKYKSLSRGMESALGLIIGLASRAELTIFDEPSLGLDAAAREYFYDELAHDFDAHPRTVIISTHMIDEVSRLFEDVVIVDKGRITLHEPLAELLNSVVTVAGPRAEVERQTQGLRILHEEMVSGGISAQALGIGENDSEALSPDEFNARLSAKANQTDGICMRSVWVDAGRRFEPGVELHPLPLQKLFVYMTEGGADK